MHAVHAELHRIAERRLRDEGKCAGIQPTELIQEVYLRVFGGERSTEWSGRGHFFAAAANAMRQFLVDSARSRKRLKRGGGKPAAPMAEEPMVFGRDPAEVLAIDEALGQLRDRDPQKARIVELRYFAGLSVDETAETLGISPRKVDKDWHFARAWLHRALS